MSLALPLFSDVTKAATDVLQGNVQGEGVFATGASVKAQTVTAGTRAGVGWAAALSALLR